LQGKFWSKGLLATTLRYSYQVRDQAAYFADIPELKLPAEMKDLAAHIVDIKTTHFDPSRFIDHYALRFYGIPWDRPAFDGYLAPTF
jgi:non-homologous end joining protein Ku